MSFKDMLQQELGKLESSSGGGDFDKVTHPASTVANDMLYFNAENTDYLVRVLPPKDLDSFFAVGFQKMFFEVTNANNKKINSLMILPLKGDPENNMLDARVQQWVKNGTMPGRYPKSGPQTRFYINVVRLESVGGGQYNHEVDEQGMPIVRVMELPRTAYEGILNDLADDNLRQPEGGGAYGAISAENAYPISISRKGTGLDTKYYVRTYEHPLGALPGGWEERLEDLNYIATPTEEYNKEFVEYMIAVYEGREADYNASRQGGATEGDTGGGQQQPATPPTQPQGNFSQPGTQPQGGGNFNQPQGGNFNQPGTQPVTDEDMGHFPPKEGFGEGQPATGQNMPPAADKVEGFNQPQNAPAQGNFSQPTQTTQNAPAQGVAEQQQPTQTTQNAPAQEANFNQPDTSGMPNVDELLAQVQKETGN